MNFITSRLFDIFLVIWTFIITSLFMVVILISKNTSLIIAQYWAKSVLFMLQVICDIKIEIRGREFVPSEGNIIIASKHQSVLETIVFLIIFKQPPIYILKQELTKIPLYGKYLVQMQAIAIDRDLGMKTLKLIIKKVKELSVLKREFLIFPEGTRAQIGEKLPYQPGIAALYDLKLGTVIPAATNSGVVWPKHGYKRAGTCIIEFMPAIPNDLPRDKFMQMLEEKIESKTDELISIDISF